MNKKSNCGRKGLYVRTNKQKKCQQEKQINKQHHKTQNKATTTTTTKPFSKHKAADGQNKGKTGPINVSLTTSA